MVHLITNESDQKQYSFQQHILCLVIFLILNILFFIHKGNYKNSMDAILIYTLTTLAKEKSP